MTKKDYVTIAACFKAELDERYNRWVQSDCREQYRPEHFYSLANRIAVELAIDNHRFDRDRFMAACGVEE